MHSLADRRRLLGLQPIGPFAPVWLTRHGLVKRLLQAGLIPLQELCEAVNARLAHTGPWAVPPTLAAFATEILCLDETRLDALGRYLKPLRGLSTHNPTCFAGKLVGLLDLRTQRWLRLEGRAAVQENCRVDMLDAFRKDSREEVCCSSIWVISALAALYFDTVAAVVGQPLAGEHILRN
jgi:hypothetical protein